VNPSFRAHFARLARRSIVRTLRQPVVFVPNLVFPLFLLAVLSGAGDRVTQVKGFPTDSFTSFVLGGMMVQAAAGALTIAGLAMGSDIETGFLSRLVLTPMKGVALLLAHLAGVAVIGLAQALLVLGVGLATGVHIEAGVAGGFAVIGIVLLVSFACGSIGLCVAVRTGSSERVQPLFSLALGLLFMSSLAMPRNLMTEHWFKDIATYNPVTYLIEAARSLFIDGWDAQALATGCGIAAGVMAIAMLASLRALRRMSVAR
jgi:ABC-2 type transport system permease protein